MRGRGIGLLIGVLLVARLLALAGYAGYSQGYDTGVAEQIGESATTVVYAPNSGLAGLESSVSSCSSDCCCCSSLRYPASSPGGGGGDHTAAGKSGGSTTARVDRTAIRTSIPMRTSTGFSWPEGREVGVDDGHFARYGGGVTRHV